MFKKTKLKPYLLTVFLVVILLTAAITAVGTIGLLNTRSNMQQFINTVLESDSAIKTCRIEVNVAARSLREMLITDNTGDYPKFTTRINESIDTINAQIVHFKKSYGEADGLAKKYEEACNVWFGIATRAIAQMEQGNEEEATAIILNECSPALNNLVEIAKEINTKTDAQKVDSEASIDNMVKIFMFVFIALFALAFIISIYFAFKTIANITGSTNKIKNAVNELSKGNLQANVDYQANNEFGELAEHMNFSFRELSKYVQAIDYGMSEFAAGNFALECPVTFIGDFVAIETSVTRFRMKMIETLSEINVATAQVYAGAEQVSYGAQSLSQGATEQASSVEELSATLNEISVQISQNATNSQKANGLGKETSEVMENSVRELAQMLKAIQDISKASEEIRNVIKVINDIASQTNILALNAAVEAARAGQAGRGFAVVADEVRNLAQKSAEAAKGTTLLIENALEAVSRGQKLVNSTNAAFHGMAEKSGQVLSLVEEIASASKEQASSVAQITQGVDQISSVVQMNSATSEESAAASEELSGQANMLKTLIGQFKIEA